MLPLLAQHIDENKFDRLYIDRFWNFIIAVRYNIFPSTLHVYMHYVHTCVVYGLLCSLPWYCEKEEMRGLVYDEEELCSSLHNCRMLCT